MEPLVSVIIVFYNTPARFIREAVESVLGQTYTNWELFLVDDGSGHESTQLALNYADHYPEKVCYLEHPGHQNLGASAARQLGIKNAKGIYLAFLDADDVWLPEKLERQVSLLEKHPEVGMVYSSSRYWYSWTGDPQDRYRDYIPRLGIPSGVIFYPPRLLLLFLRGKAAIPCPCGILVRRNLAQEIGGFVEEFRGVIDDQVFYAKVCLNSPVFAIDECWDYYRQHPTSTTALVEQAGRIYTYHVRYLSWLSDYLIKIGLKSNKEYMQLQKTINQGIWFYQQATLFGRPIKNQNFVRWLKKWVLRIEKAILPNQAQRWIWEKKAPIKESGIAEF